MFAVDRRHYLTLLKTFQVKEKRFLHFFSSVFNFSIQQYSKEKKKNVGNSYLESPQTLSSNSMEKKSQKFYLVGLP